MTNKKERTVTIRFKNGDKLSFDVTGVIKVQIADEVVEALRKRKAERS